MSTIKSNWVKAWESRKFRQQLFTGLALLVIILALLPALFNKIEARAGVVLNDWLLNFIPPHDVSIYIFLIIWACSILMIIRAARSPEIFIVLLWAYVFLLASRIISISLVPLDPPSGIIELKDPLTNLFYGNRFISKDLFYSGHTATVFLFFLCLKKKGDKIFVFACIFLLMALLLIQHVHYTVDILCAPLFALIWYTLANKVTVVK